MICPKCGAENASDSQICVSCGAELSAPKTSANAFLDKAKGLLTNKKVLLGGGIAILLLIVLIIIIAAVSGGVDYLFIEQYTMCENSDEKATLIINGSVQKTTLDAPADMVALSLDGTVSVFETTPVDEDDESYLYVVNGKKIAKVSGSEGVDDVALSVTGDGLAYTVVEDEKETLYLYKVSSKKSTKIAEADSVLGSYGITNVQIAPDGKSVIYTVNKVSEEEMSTTSTSYFSNGKEVKLGTDLTLYGLSNGGKYIYASAQKDDVTVLYKYNNKGEKTKIDEDASEIRFNLDHTQVLYYADNTTYISVNGKEGVKFFKDGVELLTPDDVLNGSTTAPVKSFYNQYYVSSTSVYLVKKNYDKSVKLVSKASGSFTLSDDAAYLYYIKDGELEMVKTSWGDNAPDKAVTISDDCDYYVVTSNCKRVYYMDDDELHSVNGRTGKSDKTVAEDVESYPTLSRKDIVYYIVDGDLYACSNGKKGERVVSDVDYAFDILGIVYATVDDDLWCTTGSKKLKKIYTNDD